MKNVIIITGHGRFASGMSSFVRMLAGNLEGVEYIDFDEGYSPATLQKTYHEKIDTYKDCNILFLCDIVGGTPFNEAVKCTVDYDRVEVVAGSNPVSVLEACFSKDNMDIKELVSCVIESTKKNVRQFVRVERNITQKDGECQGI